MGFNISGIALNKSYKNNLKELQDDLGWTLKKQSDIDFETASSNYTEAGICDVYYTDNGTLIFLEAEMCTEPFPIANTDTLSFVLYEISMSFSLNYCKNGIPLRSISENEGDKQEDSGDKLEVENKSSDTSEIIWNQLEVVLGTKFWDIQPDFKAERYVFVNEDEKQNEPHAKIENSDETTPKETGGDDNLRDYTNERLDQEFEAVVDKFLAIPNDKMDMRVMDRMGVIAEEKERRDNEKGTGESTKKSDKPHDENDPLNFNKNDKRRLEDHKTKIERIFVGLGIGIPLFTLLISIIPLSFIPQKTPKLSSDLNPASNFIESVGVLPIVILIFIATGLTIYFIMKSYNYKAVLKDSEQQKKYSFRTKVSKVVYKQGGGPSEIELSFTPAYKKKESLEFINFPNFPYLKKGAEVEIEVSVNGWYPLSIEIIPDNRTSKEINPKLHDFMRSL